MLGYPDRAAHVSDQKDADARGLGQPFDIGWSLTWGAYVFDFRREPERLMAHARRSRSDRAGAGHPVSEQRARADRPGARAAAQGELADAAALLRAGHERMERARRAPQRALHEVGAGRSAGAAGRPRRRPAPGRGVPRADRAARMARAGLAAEVLRLKGWMLMRAGQVAEAEDELRASIDGAREQKAKSWELRSATTLAELLDAGERRAGRRAQLLRPGLSIGSPKDSTPTISSGAGAARRLG